MAASSWFEVDKKGLAQLDLAWAAGVIDSDGCITIKRRKLADAVYYALFLVVGQVEETPQDPPLVLRKLSKMFGGSLQRRSADGRPGRRPMWHWAVSTRQAEDALRAVQPFLVGKQAQAQVALTYRETALGRGMRAKAESFYHELQVMKKGS